MDPSPTPAPPAPTLSVVLPVRNEGAHIEAILADLLAQESPPGGFDVWVVDGESDDQTVARAQEVAARDPRVNVVSNSLRRSSAARAIGVRASKGRYVVFVDGHCRLPTRTLLVDVCALFESTQASCLARPQPLVAEGGGPMARAIAAARSSRFGHSTASTIYDQSERAVSPVSAGAMYRREVFNQVGNFDPAFDACEDVEFNWRVQQAGLTCWTSSKLAVRYEPRRHLGALHQQMMRYGLGRARLHKKHAAAFTWESLIPLGFVLGLPVLALSPLFPLPWRTVVAVPYVLYALALVTFSVAVAARKGLDLLPLLPFVFLTVHVSLGLGYLKGWLTRQPPIKAQASDG